MPVSMLAVKKELSIVFSVSLIIASCWSCESQILGMDIAVSLNDPIEIKKTPYYDWSETTTIIINQYGSLNFSHQSAAAYGKYALFVTGGRSKFCLYNLENKTTVCTYSRSAQNSNLYHCNQSTFGVERYAPNDPFPLLYISQRNNSSGRCFIEGYRIRPQKAEDSQEYESFSIELVQTIYLPAMSYENSLGNANCAIDTSNNILYTYSRNNRSVEDNYGICKITQFKMPPARQAVVTYEDKDIINAFMLDCTAVNMQGGCIQDGILYIGQGLPSSGDLRLNVVDLEKQSLVRRFALKDFKVNWEPEGCFFYDGRLMLCHTAAIYEVLK